MMNLELTLCRNKSYYLYLNKDIILLSILVDIDVLGGCKKNML